MSRQQKVYKGVRSEKGCTVTVDSALLDLRLDLRNHSPTGFEWGYCGSGPTQLALAILADHFKNLGHYYPCSMALTFYQSFKLRVVQHLPHGGWEMTTDEIEISALPSRRT